MVSKAVRERIALAENPASDDATLIEFLAHEETLVRFGAVSNARDRPAVQAAAATSTDKWVRAILAHTYANDDDRSLAYDVQVVLSRDEFWETRQRIAQTTNYAEIFESLLVDEDTRVRGWCGGNPRITREQMEGLVCDKSARTRAIAVAVGLRFPDDDQLIRLASDRSGAVRWGVLFRPGRPREAVELIARDPNETNRRHALSALAGGMLYTAQVEEFARLKRARAERGLVFLDRP